VLTAILAAAAGKSLYAEESVKPDAELNSHNDCQVPSCHLDRFVGKAAALQNAMDGRGQTWRMGRVEYRGAEKPSARPCTKLQRPSPFIASAGRQRRYN